MRCYLTSFLSFFYILWTIGAAEIVENENITLVLNDTGIDISLYCEEGIPLLLADDSLKKCLPNGNSEMSCPRKFWCHVGATQNSRYCCPRSQKVKEQCHLAPANGYGSGQIRRFWYDWKSSTCKQLTYAGYGGNENNFLTKADCEKACFGTQPPIPSLTFSSFANKLGITDQRVSGSTVPDADLNPCELTPDKGTSVVGIPSSFRWYFDIAAERCVRFNFFGSAGNANNFETDRLCLDICGAGDITDQSICTFPVAHGSGPYKIPRFYYDARNRACKQFVYTGFGGNSNRFVNHGQCTKTCMNFGTSTSITTSVPLVATRTLPSMISTTETSTTETYTFPANFKFNFEKFKELGVLTTSLPERSAFIEGFKGLLSSITSTPVGLLPSSGASQTNAEIGAPITSGQSLPSNQAIARTISESISANTNIDTSAMPNGGSSNTQDAILRVVPSNPEINPNPAQAGATAIVDAIASAATHSCLRSLPDGLQAQYCSPSDSFLCPRGTFCQIGAGPQETFCCPMIGGNPCSQPRESGIGLTGLGRWYYDASDNQCKTFIFNGFKGNQNNFLTFRSCQQSCGAVNPCENGEPQLQTDPREQCSPNKVHSCPLGYYCRVLDDLTKSVCCPGNDQSILTGDTVDASLLSSMKSGSSSILAPNNGAISSIDYFQSRNRGTIDGSRGASSNIFPSEFAGFVGTGSASNGYPGFATGHANLNSSNMTQTNGYIGQIGTGINPGVEIPGLIGTGAIANSYSGMPRNVAVPESSFGSGVSIASSNNFIGAGTSIGSSPGNTLGPVAVLNGLNGGKSAPDLVPNAPAGTNRCLLPLATGTGTYNLPRYYFDAEASLCRPFTYAGFDGNDNNFETIQECRMTCPEYDNPCPFGTPFADEIDGSVAFCSAANPLCPANYWCHIGDRRQTTVCCPSLMGMNTPVSLPMSPAANFYAMNMMGNYNGPAQDPGIVDEDQNDMPGSISLACFQPMQPGRGQVQLFRYYFNSKTRTCDKFIYSGKGGNQNNFLSKSDCEEECPVLENPCENGLPAIGPEGNPVLCSGGTSAMCGAGYYCHIGATPSTTVCCPAIGDPCRMPVSSGNGNAVLNRWYYNAQSQLCVSFVYTGQGGNSNNFQTREDCANACPEFRNPCSSGRPHIGLSGQITHCGATGPSICPTTYWCHIGATLENSVCCPGTGVPCEQELEVGDGDAELVRFYYDSTTRTCQQFQYSGLGGNENNFLTLRDCESRCPVLPNPCAFGQPQLDEQQKPVTCGAADNSACDTDYFCHIGDTEQTTVCCPGKSSNICNEPRVPGIGRSHLSRYAYAPLTRQCLPFTYTGLGGNENNFLSRASCEAACPVVSNPCGHGEPAAGSDGQYLVCSASGPNICPAGYWCHVGADIAASLCCPGAQNPCILPVAEGSGSATIPRWYFDRRSRQCSTFAYSGYGGNQNNFQTMQECQEKCPELQNPCSTGDPAESFDGSIMQCNAMHPLCPASFFCHVGATPDTSVCCPSFGEPCLSPLVMGTGTASLNRWYFDQNSRQCLQFTYTGLGGNENNFLTADACAQKCPVLRNPCPMGGARSSLLALTKCNARNAYSCPPTYWCHIGGSADTTVCCPGAADPCQLPLSQGLISDAGPYTRWFYDRGSGSCKPFQYAGIGGNQNNFLTRNDCVKRCPEGRPIPVVSRPIPVVSRTPMPNMPGICPSGIPYQTQDGAVPHCSITNPCPLNHFCHIGEDISTTVCCKATTLMSPCTLPVQIGQGSGYLRRVYYNAALQQCIPFIYSGLGGNENNFLTVQECATKCLNQESNIRYLNSGSIESNCKGMECSQQSNGISGSYNIELQDSADNIGSNNTILNDNINNSTFIEIRPTISSVSTDNSTEVITAGNETNTTN